MRAARTKNMRIITLLAAIVQPVRILFLFISC